MKSDKIPFIAWIGFQRRVKSMENELNLKPCFFPNRRSLKFRFLDYFEKTSKTISFLAKNRPTEVWFQQPPLPLLYIMLIYKFIIRDAKVIVDCHNSVFYGKWSQLIVSHKLLNLFDLVLVHNYVIEKIAIDLGVDEAKTFILETKPAEKSITIKSNKYVYDVIVPSSFNIDEPIEIMLEAFQELPHLNIAITGDYKKIKETRGDIKIPSNVTLLGFLSKEEYESLFCGTKIALGLTTEEHIQLSVANEAVGFETPMVISDTKLLRKLFYKGTVYVNTNDSHSISSGILRCLENINELKSEIVSLKSERNIRWMEMSNALRKRKKNL